MGLGRGLRAGILSDEAPKLGVFGFVYDTHAAAKLLNNAVVRDGLADELGRGSHWREWYDAIVGGSIKDLSAKELLQPRVLGFGLV